MPELDEQTIRGDWTHLAEKAKKFIGEVATAEVEFDSTKRQEINAAVFARLDSSSSANAGQGIQIVTSPGALEL